MNTLQSVDDVISGAYSEETDELWQHLVTAR